MFCTNCGKEINDKAKFCPFCGSKNELINENIIEITAQKVNDVIPVNTLPDAGTVPNSAIPQQVTDDNGQSYDANIPSQVSYDSKNSQAAQYSKPKVNDNYQQSNNVNAKQQTNSQYSRNAGSVYKSNNAAPANHSRQSKPKSANKGLKTIFFVLLLISGLLVIGIFATLIFGVDSPADIEPILEGEPKVDDEVFTDWDKGVYSIKNIGADSIESKYIGVWIIEGMKMNVNDSTYSMVLEDDEYRGYAVIDKNGSVHSIVTDVSGMALSHAQKPYRVEDDKLITDAPDDALDGAYLQYEIVKGELAICTMIDGVQSSDWTICKKTDESIESMLNKAAAIQETETVTENDAQNPQSFEIEKKILGAWEANYENIDSYYGCLFFDDGTFIYMEVQDGEWMTDTVYSYEIISPNEMVVAGNADAVVSVYVEYSDNYKKEILYISSDTDVLELLPVNELNPPE